MYYLLDLERSLHSLGQMYFWRPLKRGYCTTLDEAGLYSEEAAKEIVESDFDKRTVMISEETVKGILKNT